MKRAEFTAHDQNLHRFFSKVVAAVANFALTSAMYWQTISHQLFSVNVPVSITIKMAIHFASFSNKREI